MPEINVDHGSMTQSSGNNFSAHGPANIPAMEEAVTDNGRMQLRKNPKKSTRYNDYCMISVDDAVNAMISAATVYFDATVIPEDVWLEFDNEIQCFLATDNPSYDETLIGPETPKCSAAIERELNSLIDTLFDNKTLRGISLKKLKSIERTSDVKLVLNKVTPVPNYTFDRVITSTNPLGSIGIKIIANRISSIETENGSEIMDVRSFSGPDNLSDVSGEVVGDSARHGKVGLQRINTIIRNINPEIVIPTKNELYSKTDSVLKSDINQMNIFFKQDTKIFCLY
jgi:hypothetical protein